MNNEYFQFRLITHTNYCLSLICRCHALWRSIYDSRTNFSSSSEREPLIDIQQFMNKTIVYKSIEQLPMSGRTILRLMFGI